jgi:hypothetical protein
MTSKTPENGHSGPQEGLEALSGRRAMPEGENGRETGADGLDTHNAGPSIREAADNDRAHWERKYAGEGQ